MRGSKPRVDPALLEIVRHEIRAFTGKTPLRTGESGLQDALTDDLVSAGHEALLRAIDYFDPARGYKLQTYASRVVRNAIRHAARPRKMDALTGGHELVRLDSVSRTAEDERLSLHEIVPDDAEVAFQVPEAAWRCLQRIMPEREFDVLLSRYAGYTRIEVGERLGVSAERVRQIGQRALKVVEELYRVNSELRLAIDAARYYAEQMADAKRAVVASQASQAGWWAYRDGLRFKEAEAGAYREPKDWHEALLTAARLAMVELDVSADGQVRQEPQGSPPLQPSDWQDALTIAAADAAIAPGVPYQRLCPAQA